MANCLPAIGDKTLQVLALHFWLRIFFSRGKISASSSLVADVVGLWGGGVLPAHDPVAGWTQNIFFCFSSKFREIFAVLESEGLYSPEFVPQLEDVSAFLRRMGRCLLTYFGGLQNFFLLARTNSSPLRFYTDGGN